MSTSRRIAWAVCLGLIVLGLGQAWRAHSTASRVRTAMVEVQKRTQLVETELRRAGRRNRTSESARKELGPILSESGELKTLRSNSEVPRPAAGPDASQLIATHPKLAADFEKAFRAQFTHDYSSLYGRLGLSTGQINRFEQRLFQDQLDKLDLTWTARTQGLKGNDPALQAIRRNQEAALDADLQAILGGDGYEALANFRRANGAREFVNDLATAMTLTECAMTRGQQDRLLQVMADASASYQKGGKAIPWDVNWNAVMARAPEILSPEQIAALRVNGDHQVRLVWMLPQFYDQQSNQRKSPGNRSAQLAP